MGTKKKNFKVVMTLASFLTAGVIAAVLMLALPAGAAKAVSVKIDEAAGNVQVYDADLNAFLEAKPEQALTPGQTLLTGPDSWARLSAFEDGTALHLDAQSSVQVLSSGEQDGQLYARLRVDQGTVTLVPRDGRVYLETPGGIAFGDNAVSALQVIVQPNNSKAEVACLAGTCRFNHAGGGIILKADERVVMVDGSLVAASSSDPSPVAEAAGKIDEETKASAAPVAGDHQAASPVYQCGPPEGWSGYTVADGDTFTELLQRFDVSSEDFRQANCLGDLEMVVSGLKLFVPAVSVAVVPSPAKEDNQQVQQVNPTATPEVTLPPTEGPTQVPTQAPTESPTQSPGQPPEEGGSMRVASVIMSQEVESNPGMGWQYRAGTYPITDPAETVAYAPRSEISWRVLNPAEGVYDWSELDAHLNLAVSQGKQFSFRVYTMRGEDYGGHQFPAWVVDKGALFMPSGEPNYSSCVYQQEWGKFVNKLVQRYDGNPNIAFIDISGYGDFNEWSWRDDQTTWDDAWADAYADGTASRSTMAEMDSFARRVLADMFIGGSYGSHECLDASGNPKSVSYSYNGFSQTQLIMPYAGVRQATQYVFTQDKTVGFRYDCLGREKGKLIVEDEKLGKEVDAIWPVAPVIFETCKDWDFTVEDANYLLREAHGTMVHDVNIEMGPEAVRDMMEPLGYRYELKKFEYTDRISPGSEFQATMVWQNSGYAPSYPRMGQDFELHVYILNAVGELVKDILVDEDISKWMPASNPGGTPPTYAVSIAETIGSSIPAGIYSASVEIIDTRTGQPIWLPYVVSP